MKEGKVVDHGLGVLHKDNKLVTFRKYFSSERTSGKIFFKKLDQGEKFPLSYDLSKNNHSKFIVNKG